MELAYCQRCGCFFEKKDPDVGDYIIVKIVSQENVEGNADWIGLCPKCMKSFDRWLNALRIEEGE